MDLAVLNLLFLKMPGTIKKTKRQKAKYDRKRQAI